jgi:spermidine synthase
MNAGQDATSGWTGPYRWGLLLAFLSGAAGLTHQLLWTRRLIDLLGADAGTFARVIGAFFGGLALGAWLASRPAPGRVNFWRRVAWAEFGVAVFSVPVWASAWMADWLWSRAAVEWWIQWAGPAVMVLPPAVFMGLVLPWMLRALLDHAGADRAVRIYAANILGGVGGVVLVMGAGLPRLGLVLSGMVAMGLNVVAGLLAAWLGLQGGSRVEGQADGKRVGGEARAGLWPARMLALASGFLVLSAEVVVQHQFAQVTINSMFSSATVLVLVLAGLTAGALLVPAAVVRLGDERRVLVWAGFVACVLWLAEPFVLVGLTGGLRMVAYDMSPAAYTMQVGALGVVTLMPAFVAAGMLFPLALRFVARSGGETRSRETGLLFAWNGLGGWVGAEVTSAWIAPGLGLWVSIWWIGSGYAVVGLLAWCWGRARGGWRLAARSPALVATGCCLAVTRVFLGLLPQAGTTGDERVASVVVGREGVVAAVSRGPDHWRIRFNNAYSLGGSRAQFNQERQAHIPLLLHGNARSVALLGVATGSTAAGAALHTGVERIDAIELSPAVLRLAEEYFGPYNRAVFDDPRVRVIQADARRVMAGARGDYDVVLGDLFLPWRTGEGRLFTLEHFRNVERSLREGGLYCQWLPMYQLTRAQYETIVRTFLAVFPDGFLVRGDFYATRPIAALVGGRPIESLDWEAIEAACARLRGGEKTPDPVVRHEDGIAMMVVGPLAFPGPGPKNTLGNAWIEWDAGRNILGQREPWFVGARWVEYLGGLHGAGIERMPVPRRSAHGAGQYFAELDVVGRGREGGLEELRGQMADWLPAGVLRDGGVAWELWPMVIGPPGDESLASPLLP